MRQLSIAARFNIPSPIIARKGENLPTEVTHCLESDLYAKAGVNIRVSGVPDRVVRIYGGDQNYYKASCNEFIVGVPGFKGLTETSALKALEVLAYGFNDYKARESMCGFVKFAIRPGRGRKPLNGKAMTTSQRVAKHRLANLQKPSL